MTRDRVTMTRAEALRIRQEEEQKRRENLVKQTLATPKLIPINKPKAKPAARTNQPAIKPALTGRYSRRYDVAMTTPYGRNAVPKASAKAASFSIPKISRGPRWVSFVLMVLCIASLVLITGYRSFIVNNANVLGNNRVSAEEISSAMGAMGVPSAMINPAQIEYNILAAFPDIATAQVEINLPAEIIVTVTERQPIAAWSQDGKTVWVDAQGYAFPPRGFVEGLVTVNAVGSLSRSIEITIGQQQGVGAKPFLTSEMAAALMALTPRVPQGSSLVYDPRYGLGWADPHGWQAYFGHTHGDVNTKLQIYQSMVDHLSKQGITPVIISVEYPDAPFYRMEN